MYKLLKDNLIKETSDELKRDELIVKGWKLVEDEKKPAKPKKDDTVATDAPESGVKERSQWPSNVPSPSSSRMPSART